MDVFAGSDPAPDMPEETLWDALDLLEQYVHLLDQEALTAKYIL